jgi:hypothetical protein
MAVYLLVKAAGRTAVGTRLIKSVFYFIRQQRKACGTVKNVHFIPFPFERFKLFFDCILIVFLYNFLYYIIVE